MAKYYPMTGFRKNLLFINDTLPNSNEGDEEVLYVSDKKLWTYDGNESPP